MKIIKKGSIKTKVTEFECDKCNSVISATIDEGKYMNDQRDGDYVAFYCPVCGEVANVDVTLFKEKKVPK